MNMRLSLSSLLLLLWFDQYHYPLINAFDIGHSNNNIGDFSDRIQIKDTIFVLR